MTPETRSKILAEFDSDDPVAVVARRVGVGRDRLTKVWKEEFGANSVRERSNRLRALSTSQRGRSSDPRVREEALDAFNTSEPMKAAARRLGVHYTKIKEWWVSRYSEEGVRERARQLQKKRARESGASRRGSSNRVRRVQVPCDSCGATVDLSAGSVSKRAKILCDNCLPKKKNPVACPVCEIVCEGPKGLSLHFRHSKDDPAHQKYERGSLATDTSLEGLKEGEDYVRCQVCGMAAKSLSSHIRVHGLNWVEYARKFPGFSLWSRKSYEYRRARLQETHQRAGLTEKDLAPYTDEKGDLVVAAAAKGLKFSQSTIREYAKLLDIPTRNRLSAQKQVLDLISGILGERYVWEWSDDRVRSPETNALLYYDGFFRRHNLLVEYHGPQHFQFVPRWHRTPEGFDRQQEVDRYKARRAEELGIELVVVRHTDDIGEESLRNILHNRVGYQERQQRRETAAEAAMENLRGCDFPLPERPSSEEAAEVLEKLRRLRQREEKGILLPRSYTGNALCRRYFPNIYKARRKGHPSAVECWNDDQELRKAVLTQIDAGHPTTPERVLKALTFHHRLPAVFRPAFARFIYEKFARPGDLVWDPCSGYGGRLLGAAAAGVRYVGTDIEPETVEGNLALAADLGYEADVRLVSALDADIPEVSLVFTSPPYFDMEQYSDRKGQPHISYEGRSDWIERFLFPLVGRASGALSTGGRLVFVLPDDLHIVSSPEILQKGFIWDAEIGFELPNGKVSKAVAYRKK